MNKKSKALNAINKAINSAGGQTALAKKLGISPQAIQQWLIMGVPSKRVLVVEKVTGVSRHELRPDLYPREAA